MKRVTRHDVVGLRRSTAAALAACLAIALAAPAPARAEPDLGDAGPDLGDAGLAALIESAEALVLADRPAELLASDAGLAVLSLHARLAGANDLTESWERFCASLGLGADDGLARLLGDRAAFVLGRSAPGEARPWAVATRIGPSMAARLRDALRATARRAIDGRPVYAIEDGRFELAVSRDGRTLVIATSGGRMLAEMVRFADTLGLPGLGLAEGMLGVAASHEPRDAGFGALAAPADPRVVAVVRPEIVPFLPTATATRLGPVVISGWPTPRGWRAEFSAGVAAESTTGGAAPGGAWPVFSAVGLDAAFGLAVRLDPLLVDPSEAGGLIPSELSGVLAGAAAPAWMVRVAPGPCGLTAVAAASDATLRVQRAHAAALDADVSRAISAGDRAWAAGSPGMPGGVAPAASRRAGARVPLVPQAMTLLGFDPTPWREGVQIRWGLAPAHDGAAAVLAAGCGAGGDNAFDRVLASIAEERTPKTEKRLVLLCRVRPASLFGSAATPIEGIVPAAAGLRSLERAVLSAWLEPEGGSGWALRGRFEMELAADAPAE